MKTKTFCITEDQLLNFLRKFGNGPDSKDYEFAISIYVKRFFEKKFNKSFFIAFELNREHQEKERVFFPTPEEVNSIIRSYLEQDTPVDFALAPGTLENSEGQAFPFQVKRFLAPSENFVDNLIRFINEKFRSYRSPEVSLVIIPEIKSDLEYHLEASIEDISKKIDPLPNNLRAIFIFTSFKGKSMFMQIWPKYYEFQI